MQPVLGRVGQRQRLHLCDGRDGRVCESCAVETRDFAIFRAVCCGSSACPAERSAAGWVEILGERPSAPQTATALLPRARLQRLGHTSAGLQRFEEREAQLFRLGRDGEGTCAISFAMNSTGRGFLRCSADLSRQSVQRANSGTAYTVGRRKRRFVAFSRAPKESTGLLIGHWANSVSQAARSAFHARRAGFSSITNPANLTLPVFAAERAISSALSSGSMSSASLRLVHPRSNTCRADRLAGSRFPEDRFERFR